MTSCPTTGPAIACKRIEPPRPLLFLDSEPSLPFKPSADRSSNRVLELERQNQASLAVPPTSHVTPEEIATWRARISVVSKAERDMFLQYEAADLKQYVTAIESALQDHGRKSRALKVANVLNPLFEFMNMYAPIAQTMIQADPTPSALIFGGITCIMSISKRFKDYQEKMLKMLSKMLEKLDILLKYGDNIYKNDTEAQKALMEVYGDVLDFCITASRLFLDDRGNERSSLKTLLTSLWTSFESKFSGILERFERHIEAFESCATYVDRERGIADRAAVNRFMQYQAHGTNEVLQESHQVHCDVVAIRNQMSVAHERHEEEEEKARAERQGEKRRKIIEWLPSIPFHQDQEDKYTKRLDGTGQWLIVSEVFQTWKMSSNSGLLWVHGKNGCGKSHLAARVVQDLIEDTSRANKDKRNAEDIVALAYIYCNSLEATKIDPSKLIGSLLNQLCHHLPHPEIEQSLESLYESQTEAPTRQDMQKAIISIIARFSRTFIVIDGLDECHELDDPKFEELCEFMAFLVQPNSTNSVAKRSQPKAISSIANVIVFSRPEYLEIKKAFGDCPRIQVDDGANDNDIKEFIAREFSAKDLFVKKIPDLLKQVEDRLLSGADGMFLWVDLLIKTLLNSRTSGELKAKLKVLPRTLEEAYEESLRRILKQDDFVRPRALKILLWTTNAKRALSQDELKEALAIEPNMTELDDESDSKICDDAGFAAECGDLIVLVNGRYHLLHSSLKDYLGKLPTSSSNLLEEYGLMQKKRVKNPGGNMPHIS